MPIDVMSNKPNKDAIIAVVGGILCRNCSELVNMHILRAFLCQSYT